METRYTYIGPKSYNDSITQQLINSADSIYCEKDSGTMLTINLDRFIEQNTCFGGVDRMFKVINNKVGGGIKKVIFNDPATIVYWNTGEKTVVKCTEGEAFDKEKGLLCAILKYECGNDNRYHRLFKEWCD